MRIAARPDASEVCISKNGNATYGYLFLQTHQNRCIEAVGVPHDPRGALKHPAKLATIFHINGVGIYGLPQTHLLSAFTNRTAFRRASLFFRLEIRH
ncbi:hypothetical protein [Rhizobium sp.]|uniref:hypothetical protein n=1 Tax=Rhizobium sp. TaxID=391 RepID=UPI0028B1FA98